MKRITNIHGKRESVPVVLTRPAGALLHAQKTSVDLRHQQSMAVEDDEIGPEVMALLKKGHILLEDVTPKKKFEPVITIVETGEQVFPPKDESLGEESKSTKKSKLATTTKNSE